MNGNIIIKNSSQLVTCSGFMAKRGKDMSDLKIINDGAVVIEGGMIKEVGKTGDILQEFDETNFKIIDAVGKAVYRDLLTPTPILSLEAIGRKSFPGGFEAIVIWKLWSGVVEL